MNTRAAKKLIALATLTGLATVTNAACPGSRLGAELEARPDARMEARMEARMDARLGARPVLLAQAAPPAPAASAPAADAQPENRDTPARPAARRRGVGVVISMNVA